MRLLHQRAQDEHGAIAIMAAVLVTAVVLAGALAVDVGRAAYVSRDQQGATDRAALDSAQTLRAVDNEASPEALNEAHLKAVESLARNPMTGTQRERRLYRLDLGVATDPNATGFDLVCGAFFDENGTTTRSALVSDGILAPDGDPDVAPDSAAAQDEPVDCGGDGIEGTYVDAVRVWTHGGLDYVLAIGESGTTMHKLASARATPSDEECPEDDPDCREAEGTFSVGSTLASMDDGLLDQWLIGAIGLEGTDAAEFDVDLVGYRGVADARVRLRDLVASDSLTVGSVDELLTTDILVTDLIQATIDVLEAEGTTASIEAAAELDDLLSSMTSWTLEGTERRVRLGHPGEDGNDLGGLSAATGSAAGADVRVDAIDLVLMAIEIANGDSGIDLDLDVFGEPLTVTMTAVEPPVIETGPRGTQAHSSQVTLDFDADLDAIVGANSDLESLVDSIVDDLLGGLLGILGGSPELTLQEVGVHVSAAEGVGTLTDIGCQMPGSLTIESVVTAGSVAVSGDLYDVDGDMLSALDPDGLSIVIGESSAPTKTILDGPFTTGPVRAPDGGAGYSTSLSLDDLTGEFADDLDSDAVDDTLALLETALVGSEGVVNEILDQLGLSLTTVDLMAYDYNCTDVDLQPSVSDN